MLTPEHKLKIVDIIWTLLIRFLANPKNFHCILVTQDETWVYHVEPESKIQSQLETLWFSVPDLFENYKYQIGILETI